MYSIISTVRHRTMLQKELIAQINETSIICEFVTQEEACDELYKRVMSLAKVNHESEANMAMIIEPADPREKVQEIIYQTDQAINALEQYINALHKLEESFLSESAVQIITYGDVQETIRRLYQTKESLENGMRQCEKYLEYDAHAQDLLD